MKMSDPKPVTCPTCGSDDPKKATYNIFAPDCPDAFHSRTEQPEAPKMSAREWREANGYKTRYRYLNPGDDDSRVEDNFHLTAKQFDAALEAYASHSQPPAEESGMTREDVFCKHCLQPIFDNGTVYVHRKFAGFGFAGGKKPTFVEDQWCDPERTYMAEAICDSRIANEFHPLPVAQPPAEVHGVLCAKWKQLDDGCVARCDQPQGHDGKHIDSVIAISWLSEPPAEADYEKEAEWVWLCPVHGTCGGECCGEAREFMAKKKGG